MKLTRIRQDHYHSSKDNLPSSQLKNSKVTSALVKSTRNYYQKAIGDITNAQTSKNREACTRRAPIERRANTATSSLISNVSAFKVKTLSLFLSLSHSLRAEKWSSFGDVRELRPVSRFFVKENRGARRRATDARNISSISCHG